MTTPESAPDPRELERVRAVTLAVLRTLDESHKPMQAPSGRVAAALAILRSNWVLVLASASLVLALLGWILKGVSPLHAIDEVAHRQEQRRFQRELVQRYIGLGNDFLSLGQLDAAQTEFTQASTLDPYNMDARFGLLKASVFKPISANDYDPEIAERRLHAILSERPGDTHALGYLGNVYYSIDADSASSYYDQAIRSDSTNALAYFGKGIVYDERRQADDALAMYERASALSPWNQTFLNNLGYQHYQRGNYRKAESLYIRLLRLGSQYILSQYMLANAQLMLGRPELAYRNLQLLEEDLRDTVTLGLPRNKGGWFFHVGGAEPERLYDSREKAAYGRYLMVVAAYLRNDLPSTHRHLRDVAELAVRHSRYVETIIWADLRTLRQAQPAMRARIDGLEGVIWPGGFPWPRPVSRRPVP